MVVDVSCPSCVLGWAPGWPQLPGVPKPHLETLSLLEYSREEGTGWSFHLICGYWIWELPLKVKWGSCSCGLDLDSSMSPLVTSPPLAEQVSRNGWGASPTVCQSVGPRASGEGPCTTAALGVNKCKEPSFGRAEGVTCLRWQLQLDPSALSVMAQGASVKSQPGYFADVMLLVLSGCKKQEVLSVDRLATFPCCRGLMRFQKASSNL